jgi:hypothetical protein
MSTALACSMDRRVFTFARVSVIISKFAACARRLCRQATALIRPDTNVNTFPLRRPGAITIMDGTGARVTQRAPQSCQRCSFKKMRCSKTVPCEACINQGLAVQCRRETVIVSKQIRSARSRRQRATRPMDDPHLALGRDSSSQSHALLQSLNDEARTSRPSPDHEATAAMLINFAHQPLSGEADDVNDVCNPVGTSRLAPAPDTATYIDWNQAWPRISDHETISPRSTQEGASPFETTFSALEYLVWGRLQDSVVSSGVTNVSAAGEMGGAGSALTHLQAIEIMKYHSRWLTWTHNFIHWPKFREECRLFWEKDVTVEKAWLALYYAVLCVSSCLAYVKSDTTYHHALCSRKSRLGCTT